MGVVTRSQTVLHVYFLLFLLSHLSLNSFFFLSFFSLSNSAARSSHFTLSSLSLCLSARISALRLSACLSVRLCVNLSVSLSVCRILLLFTLSMDVSVFVWLYSQHCLCLSPSASVSVCLCHCLSLYKSMMFSLSGNLSVFVKHGKFSSLRICFSQEMKIFQFI